MQTAQLNVQVTVPQDSSREDEAARKSRELEDQDAADASVALPIAFPKIPVDRYGFLTTDKCVALLAVSVARSSVSTERPTGLVFCLGDITKALWSHRPRTRSGLRTGARRNGSR